MSDSDWHDPFADDPAAREREARRAERERRRRERQQSLGERVEEIGSEPAPTEPSPPAPPPVPADPAPSEPEPPASEAPAPAEPVAEIPAEPDYTAEHPEALRAAEPPDQRPTRARRGPSPDAVRRRRIGGLVGLGALIVLIAGAGVVISRMGDDEPAAAPTEARKVVEVVIPEGLSRGEIAPVVKKAKIGGDYVKASKSSKAINLKRYGAEGADSLEGFLFPASYELFKGDDADVLVEKQLQAFQDNLAQVNLKQAQQNGYSVYDVVIVASMVEREIAIPEERKLAASVIYNRLDAGNPLGIDATIRFEDSNWTEPLLQSRLDTPSPYNTRINAGLPPGPIGNPGLASLEAAANPAKTDFFYYVIKPGTCNEHTFVETEAEFSAAEAEYQAALEAEGGSPTEC